MSTPTNSNRPHRENANYTNDILAKQLYQQFNNSFQCHLCEKSFMRNKYLRRHVVNVHNQTSIVTSKLPAHNLDQRFACQTCDKSYKLKKHLNRHVRECHSNADRKSFSCHLCDKSYVHKKDLKRHARNNHGINSLIIAGAVEVNDLQENVPLRKEITPLNDNANAQQKRNSVSDKRFSDGKKLKKDQLLLSNKQDENTLNIMNSGLHQCNECTKFFQNSTHLKRHKLSHAGTRIHQCHQCKMRFVLPQHLKRHAQSHRIAKRRSHNGKHACQLCNTSFLLKQHLRVHLKTSCIAADSVDSKVVTADTISDSEVVPANTISNREVAPANTISDTDEDRMSAATSDGMEEDFTGYGMKEEDRKVAACIKEEVVATIDGKEEIDTEYKNSTAVDNNYSEAEVRVLYAEQQIVESDAHLLGNEHANNQLNNIYDVEITRQFRVRYQDISQLDYIIEQRVSDKETIRVFQLEIV